MSFRRVVIRRSLVLLPLLLMLTGCPFSPDHSTRPPIIPDSPYHARTSISDVLYNLKLSYNEKNIEEYRLLLNDEYTYVFDPKDVGHNGIPDSWGKADDILSAEHLFSKQPNLDGYKMEAISLNFEEGADVVSTVEPTWRMVTLSQIMLLIDTRNAAGEALRYEVLGDQADIHFIKTNEIDPKSGLNLWQIIYWVDRPVTLLAKN
jgi:hypothetical protein